MQRGRHRGGRVHHQNGSSSSKTIALHDAASQVPLKIHPTRQAQNATKGLATASSNKETCVETSTKVMRIWTHSKEFEPSTQKRAPQDYRGRRQHSHRHKNDEGHERFGRDLFGSLRCSPPTRTRRRCWHHDWAFHGSSEGRK